MAGDISRQNGKKGGRKKGLASIKAEQARALLAQMVADEIEPIGKALILQAKKGDAKAAKELFDRAFGKAPQFMEITGKDGKDFIPSAEVLDRAEKALTAFLNGGNTKHTQ